MTRLLFFERFIKKYGKPLLYIGGERKDTYDYCKKKKINCIFANLEGNEKIKVKTIRGSKELENFIQQL